MTLSSFDLAAILIVLAAVFGYVNPPLRPTASLGRPDSDGRCRVPDHPRPGSPLPASETTDSLVALTTSIDFHQALMNGMLSFLLFAGALHVE